MSIRKDVDDFWNIIQYNYDQIRYAEVKSSVVLSVYSLFFTAAYTLDVLDEENAFEENFDTTFSDIFRVQGNEKDVTVLKKLITKHKNYTGSKLSEKILNNWKSYESKFFKILPREFGKIINRDNREEFILSE